MIRVHDRGDGVRPAGAAASEGLVTAQQVLRLRATLDRDGPVPREGDPVPPGWHHLFFPPLALTRELRPDGLAPHPADAAGAPAARMVTAIRSQYHRPLRIGAPVRRATECVATTTKRGRSGLLVFETIRHTVTGPDGVAVVDEWDLLVRRGRAAAGPAERPRAPVDAPWQAVVDPTPVLLFRYSAVMFNAHRIHYDLPYATGAEGFAGLVVQGPLVALLLLGLVHHHRPGDTVAALELRARAPLFAGRRFKLLGRPQAGGRACDLWAVAPDETIAVQATVRFG